MVYEKVVNQESGRKITATTTITIILIVVNDVMMISHYSSESVSCFQFDHECSVRKNYVFLHTCAGV